jgi:hypothetical protein
MSGQGKRWLARLERARAAAERAEAQRDELARQALAAGLGVRGVGLGLGIDKATVSVAMEAAMSIERARHGKGGVLRWREGGKQRSRLFERKGDAEDFDAERRRRGQLGPLAVLC